MPEQTLDFGFVARDVNRQREIAQDALTEAKRIDALLQDPNLDVQHRNQLEEAKQKWLSIARELADNIVTTSTAASATISSVQRK
jgi:hypothetical protein